MDTTGYAAPANYACVAVMQQGYSVPNPVGGTIEMVRPGGSSGGGGGSAAVAEFIILNESSVQLTETL